MLNLITQIKSLYINIIIIINVNNYFNMDLSKQTSTYTDFKIIESLDNDSSPQYHDPLNRHIIYNNSFIHINDKLSPWNQDNSIKQIEKYINPQKKAIEKIARREVQSTRRQQKSDLIKLISERKIENKNNKLQIDRQKKSKYQKEYSLQRINKQKFQIKKTIDLQRSKLNNQSRIKLPTTSKTMLDLKNPYSNINLLFNQRKRVKKPLLKIGKNNLIETIYQKQIEENTKRQQTNRFSYLKKKLQKSKKSYQLLEKTLCESQKIKIINFPSKLNFNIMFNYKIDNEQYRDKKLKSLKKCQNTSFFQKPKINNEQMSNDLYQQKIQEINHDDNSKIISQSKKNSRNRIFQLILRI